MIVQLAGLPGTGKSSLAAELVHRLEGRLLLLDKDRVRQALFGPQHTLYTREQDDFCVGTMFRTAVWHLRHSPSSIVIFDGRTCSRAYQVAQVRRFASRTRQPLRLIECVCPDTAIDQRLRADTARGTHPAANRDIRLYRRLRASADPIPDPKLRLDTTGPLLECADRALSYLHHPLPTDPDPVHPAARPSGNEVTA
ncbi:MAG: AAA family ATPase [Pseudonocardiaceae bacterium]